MKFYKSDDSLNGVEIGFGPLRLKWCWLPVWRQISGAGEELVWWLYFQPQWRLFRESVKIPKSDVITHRWLA